MAKRLEGHCRLAWVLAWVLFALCAAGLFAPNVQDAQAIALWQDSSGTYLWGNWFGWGCYDEDGNARGDWSDNLEDDGDKLACWNCGHTQHCEDTTLTSKALTSKCTATECYRYARCEACGTIAFLVRYEHNTGSYKDGCSVCGYDHTCGSDGGLSTMTVRSCITAKYCPTCLHVYEFSVGHKTSETYYKYTYKNESVHSRLAFCTTCKTAWNYDSETEAHTLEDGKCTLCQAEHEHSYAWVVTKKATCQEEGTKQYVCSDCGDVNGTLTIDKGDHSLVTGAWKNGQRSITCENCSYEEVEICPHTDEDGDNCSVCGKALRYISVTVPTSLPVTVDGNGNVQCASNAKIVNNSTAAVKVSGIDIEACGKWSLAAYSSNPASKSVDSKLFAFSLTKLGSTAQGKTSNTSDTQSLLSKETTIAQGASARIGYAAKLSSSSKALTNEKVAKVTFTVGWAS